MTFTIYTKIVRNEYLQNGFLYCGIEYELLTSAYYCFVVDYEYIMNDIL